LFWSWSHWTECISQVTNVLKFAVRSRKVYWGVRHRADSARKQHKKNGESKSKVTTPESVWSDWVRPQHISVLVTCLLQAENFGIRRRNTNHWTAMFPACSFSTVKDCLKTEVNFREQLLQRFCIVPASTIKTGKHMDSVQCGICYVFYRRFTHFSTNLPAQNTDCRLYNTRFVGQISPG
jgi:hypothetical protein